MAERITRKLSASAVPSRDECRFGPFDVVAINSRRILESECHHDSLPYGSGDTACKLCLFKEKLSLPQLPDMVYPYNGLIISLHDNPSVKIEFNSLDALMKVNATTLPDVQVGPSAVWQQAQKALGFAAKVHHPYDWTYFSDYQGTTEGFEEVPTTEVIGTERLTRDSHLTLYSEVRLYDDEMADHGCIAMNVRIRVMATFLFVLVRYFLRVDGVFVRVCDTRLYFEKDTERILKERTLREAHFDDLSKDVQRKVLDSNGLFEEIPLVERITTQLMIPQ